MNEVKDLVIENPTIDEIVEALSEYGEFREAGTSFGSPSSEPSQYCEVGGIPEDADEAWPDDLKGNELNLWNEWIAEGLADGKSEEDAFLDAVEKLRKYINEPGYVRPGVVKIRVSDHYSHAGFFDCVDFRAGERFSLKEAREMIDAALAAEAEEADLTRERLEEIAEAESGPVEVEDDAYEDEVDDTYDPFADD